MYIWSNPSCNYLRDNKQWVPWTGVITCKSLSLSLFLYLNFISLRSLHSRPGFTCFYPSYHLSSSVLPIHFRLLRTFIWSSLRVSCHFRLWASISVNIHGRLYKLFNPSFILMRHCTVVSFIVGPWIILGILLSKRLSNSSIWWWSRFLSPMLLPV